MAKGFFHVCAGLLMLAASYNLGASSAGAQAPGNPCCGRRLPAGWLGSSDDCQRGQLPTHEQRRELVSAG
jgi:hypothetical protein